MKPGFTFQNGTMQLTCLCFTESERGNLALLIDHKNGLFITARDVSQENNGSFSWAWGHYFYDIHNAIIDFDERNKTLEVLL